MKEIYGYGRKYEDIIKKQKIDLINNKELSAKAELEKLGYIQDKEPRFKSKVSYTKYCEDGCCIVNELVFYENGVTCDDCFITFALLQAINKQIEELG